MSITILKCLYIFVAWQKSLPAAFVATIGIRQTIHKVFCLPPRWVAICYELDSLGVWRRA